MRARLLLAVATLSLAGFLVADVATYTALRSFLVDRTDRSLAAAHEPLVRVLFESSEFGHHGDGEDRNREEAAFAAAAPGAYVELRDDQHDVVLSGSARGEFESSTPDLPKGAVLRRGEDSRYLTVDANEDGAAPFRVLAQRLPDDGTILVALSLDDVHDTLGRLLIIGAIVTAAVLVGVIALGFWLVRVGLRPLTAIEATASGIAAGALSTRVNEDEGTEVGRLGASLNAMLGRIEAAFDRQAESEAQLRRFVADASHELRTPVSAVAAYAELFERGARDRPEDLARLLRGIRAETSRMESLIDDLLLLARIDEGRPLERQAVDLVSVVGAAVEAARVLGPDWPVTMSAVSPFEVDGDPRALRQIVDNLLGNARSHTPPGTAVHVAVRNDGDEVVLEVSDRGPGLTPEHAARVFERFYRADPSRARDRGGAGLGLAVVRAIAEAHGGSVDLETAPGAGATFRVRLPKHQTSTSG